MKAIKNLVTTAEFCSWSFDIYTLIRSKKTYWHQSLHQYHNWNSKSLAFHYSELAYHERHKFHLQWLRSKVLACLYKLIAHNLLKYLSSRPICQAFLSNSIKIEMLTTPTEHLASVIPCSIWQKAKHDLLNILPNNLILL